MAAGFYPIIGDDVHLVGDKGPSNLLSIDGPIEGTIGADASASDKRENRAALIARRRDVNLKYDSPRIKEKKIGNTNLGLPRRAA